LSQHDFVLWLDLETTGVNEFDDLILEVGAILTPRDCSRELIAFVNVVDPDDAHWKDKMCVEAREMHEWSGLVEAIDSGVGESLAEIESRLLMEIRGVTGSTNHVILAGSGVAHFDRRFIRQQMPALDRALTYWAWDVGVVRRLFREVLPENAVAKLYDFREKPHRALLDARNHLAEWRRYGDFIRFINEGKDYGRG
jgi:oligoribonuclease (3'-5' exoribonuclease)